MPILRSFVVLAILGSAVPASADAASAEAERRVEASILSPPAPWHRSYMEIVTADHPQSPRDRAIDPVTSARSDSDPRKRPDRIRADHVRFMVTENGVARLVLLGNVSFSQSDRVPIDVKELLDALRFL